MRLDHRIALFLVVTSAAAVEPIRAGCVVGLPLAARRRRALVSPPLRALPRNLTPFAACLGLALLAGAPSRAAPKPLTPEEQAKVDRAIEKGIAFLKSTQ